MPIEHRPLLGVSEAAALTGLDEKIVRQAIRQGELIACYAHSSTKRIRRRDLDDWISSLPERPPHGSFESCGGRVFSGRKYTLSTPSTYTEP